MSTFANSKDTDEMQQYGSSGSTVFIKSGLDKDLDQWVFLPLLFNLMSILLHI